MLDNFELPDLFLKSGQTKCNQMLLTSLKKIVKPKSEGVLESLKGMEEKKGRILTRIFQYSRKNLKSLNLSIMFFQLKKRH